MLSVFDLYQKIIDFSLDLVDQVKYEILGFRLPDFNLPKQVSFKFMFDEKDGHYLATATDYPGLITYGRDTKELWENLNDAVMTYFNVPRATALRLGNPYDLPLPNGERIVQKKTIALA